MLKTTGHKPNEEREFVPSSFGNRQDPTPCRVWIRTPTEKDKREIHGDRSVVRFAVGDDGKPVIGENGLPMMEVDNQESTRLHHAAVSRCVVRVENYIGPGDVPITSGAELAEHGATDIVTEVYQEIMKSLSLSVVDAKKSEGSPSSCSGATQA